MAYGSAPYSETSFKAALRAAVANGGLGAFGAGLGAVPRGANFGTAFLASLGGSSKAYSAAQQAAQEYALKQQQAQEEADFRDYQKQHLAAQTKALEKPAPEPKKDITNMTPEEWAAYLQRTKEESVAKSAGKAATSKASGAEDTLSLTPATLDMAAKVYLETGQLPPMGMKGTKQRQAILNRASELMPGADVAQNKAGYGANARALTALTLTREQNQAFANTARQNGEILKQTLTSIPDLKFRFGNKVARWAASQAGSPQVAQFHTALQVLTPEFARILQQGAITGGGQLTDTSRKELRAVLSGDFTVPQFLASLNILYKDNENKDRSYGHQIQSLKSRMNFNSLRPDTTQADPLGIR